MRPKINRDGMSAQYRTKLIKETQAKLILEESKEEEIRKSLLKNTSTSLFDKLMNELNNCMYNIQFFERQIEYLKKGKTYNGDEIKSQNFRIND